MTEIMDRITVDPEQCGGRPCVRGMRIRVTDVLDLLAAGLTAEQILKEMPALEGEDIEACLRFASRKLNQALATWSHVEDRESGKRRDRKARDLGTRRPR